jgi:hypothetical protein
VRLARIEQRAVRALESNQDRLGLRGRTDVRFPDGNVGAPLKLPGIDEEIEKNGGASPTATSEPH